MLPPGIFIWAKEGVGATSQESLDALSALHPSWKMDVERNGSWEPFVSIDEVGHFLKSANNNEETIVVTETCGSTMEVARMLVEKGVLGEWGAVVSGLQVGGRGQLRRPWVSTAGNLHVSVVMPATPRKGEWGGA